MITGHLEIPRRIKGRFIPVALPPAGTFVGQTVLIIGGTSGVGLAAAIHFATLGADVIITYRIPSRGDAAKKHIENAVRSHRKGSVSVLTMMLDLDCYASCTGFIDELKKSVPDPATLDVALISAGMSNTEYELSPEGWERTIQVNTISTTLLGLLLLDWMRQGRGRRSSPAHLDFVTSRDHLYPDIGALAKLSKKEGGILRQISSEENWPGYAETDPNYANSKLFVMYTVAEISKLARGPGGQPLVIVNSLCPGFVRTGISRNAAARSRFMYIVVNVYMATLGKTPDHGARICTTVALKPEENHGEFFNYWFSPSLYARVAAANMTSDTAKELRKLVWQDVIRELTAKVPHLEWALSSFEEPPK
ncbi:hypothetical protein F5Y16DRAFT_365313 [Xylariaceae sp. FL0255]|nr:hypothetical protein F5Y16DRAFT_365313 [Xylariaceae sp. FL0255]